MKKRILYLALAVILILSLSQTALAAQMPEDNFKFDNGTIFTANIATQHDYLGDVKFGNLLFPDGSPCDYAFSVFVVDDSVEALYGNVYISKRPVDFDITSAYGDIYNMSSRAYFSGDEIGGYFEDSNATKDMPIKLEFIANGVPRGYSFYLDDKDGIQFGYLCYTAVVFNKSMIADFNTSGKLPSLDGTGLDLTELKALLSKATVSVSPATTSATPSNTKLMVNGNNVAVDAYAINGNNYIKLRDLATMINGTDKNFEVTWDGDKNAINLISNKRYTPAGGEMSKGDGKAKSATFSTSKIFIDGKEVPLTAYTIDGNNYFKMRDVMQIFNIYVGWDAATSTATLDTSKGYVAQ